MLHDVVVLTKRKQQRTRVMAVPPEEFGISRLARSIKDTGYCFHEIVKREEDLLSDGFDAEQVRNVPSYTGLTNPEELARDTVDEHISQGGDDALNKINRRVLVTEHYVRMDYEGNGRPSLYMVTTASEMGEILERDGKPAIEEIDEIPFAAITPIIVSHRFWGRSIADLVMDIQRIKTALIRATLDNAYLAVNPRAEVAQEGSTENTLDDLLVSRPGGIVRVKTPGTVNWQTVPSIAGEIFPVIEYTDSVREWRTGVTRAGMGIDANALQNQTATAAMQVFSAAQARIKLIARIFAETGIKDLFGLIHGTIRRHGSVPQTARLRNQWVTVDPRDWKQRNDMTVNVGLGSGGKAERMAELNVIIEKQTLAMQAGLTNLVTATNIYESAKELCKIGQFKDADRFFTNPATQAAPQRPPDPKIMEIQMQGQLQDKKQQTDAAHQQAKMQADALLEQQKFEHEKQMAVLSHELKVREANAKIQQMSVKSNIDAFKAMPDIPKVEDLIGHIKSLGDLPAQLHQVMQHVAAPAEILRDPSGRPIAVRKGGAVRQVTRGPDGRVTGLQ